MRFVIFTLTGNKKPQLVRAEVSVQKEYSQYEHANFTTNNPSCRQANFAYPVQIRASDDH